MVGHRLHRPVIATLQDEWLPINRAVDTMNM